MHSADRFVPSYFRLESQLRESIRSGAFRPGDPIPAESSLCQQFGVSRTTVRQALSRLVYDGLIERHRGRGSFVAEPRLEHTKMFLSFEEEMRARGAKPSIKLLKMRTEPAEGKVAENLGLPFTARTSDKKLVDMIKAATETTEDAPTVETEPVADAQAPAADADKAPLV